MRLLLPLVAVFGLVHAAFAAKPNVILIMADDFGYECVTANGGESYKTPVLDKLAATGLRFENCHVQPLCTPTRVQLMTGRYNVRNYLNFGTLPRQETTFGQLFKTAGFKTGICGKWQLGSEVDSPQHFGFEESCLWQQTRRPPRYTNAGLEYNGVEKDFTKGEYGPDLVNDFALEFLTKHKEEPFFLYYPMMLTHDPFQPTPDSPDYDPTLNTESKKKNARHFAEMTTYMDKLIGKLVTRLEELSLRENTLLLFVGDNGTSNGHMSRFKGADFAGGKGKTTHRGTHVPMIVSWPSVIKEGRVSAELISSTDFLPTICQAAGVNAPENVDGVSFLPQIQGEAGKAREWLYMWYSPRQSKEMKVSECAFDQTHKLYRDGRFFDLKTDPEEKSPLAAEGAEAAKLQKALDLFAQARPEELDKAFAESGKGKEPKMKKKKKKQAK
ncbi:MAG: sulfatase-like hydrolase/transferase [Verrucomicrobiota bacterium]